MNAIARIACTLLLWLALPALAAPPLIVKYNNSNILITKRTLDPGVATTPPPLTPITTMRPFRWKIRNDLFPAPSLGVNFDDESVQPWGAGIGGTFSAWPGITSPVSIGTYGARRTPDGALNVPACFSTSPYCYEAGFAEGSGGETGHRGVGRNTGTFRTFCDFSHFAYDDSIVFPGQPGRSHLHAFFGSYEAGQASAIEDIALTGKSSTCSGGTMNLTGYWVPAVIYHCPVAGLPAGCNPAWDGYPIAPSFLNAYYKGNFGFGEFFYDGVTDQWVFHNDIQPFAPNMRIIAGNPAATPGAPETGVNGLSAWQCRDSGGQDVFAQPNRIPGTGVGATDACPGTTIEIIQNVSFQACWNGIDVDSPGHQAHITGAYVNGAGLQCPSTHPVAIPGIAELIHYVLDGSPGRSLADVKFWRLASDNYDDSLPAGYSGHADWRFGWKPGIMDAIVNNVLRPGMDGHNDMLGAVPGTVPDARGPPFNGTRLMNQPKKFRHDHQ